MAVKWESGDPDPSLRTLWHPEQGRGPCACALSPCDFYISA